MFISVTKIDCGIQPLDLMWRLNISVVRSCPWHQARMPLNSALRSSRGINSVLGSKELKMYVWGGSNFLFSFLFAWFSKIFLVELSVLRSRAQMAGKLGSFAPPFPQLFTSLLSPCCCSSGLFKPKWSLLWTCAGLSDKTLTHCVVNCDIPSRASCTLTCCLLEIVVILLLNLQLFRFFLSALVEVLVSVVVTCKGNNRSKTSK